ncbi:alpha/beta fold hydrolase [Achromobacter sp.]|uniref:alpha/beta fold hydrolase n=1 Tax=Achromobacter sp. TaxID=134375 RepID=UPI002F955CD7
MRGLAVWCALAALAPLAAYAQTPLPDPYDYSETAPAPKRAAPLRWQSVELGKPGHRYKMPVYANRDLGRDDLRNIKQVVVVIHGVKRDADRYYESVAALLAHNPERARDTLILAPRFSGAIDSGFGGMAAWRKASWEDGEDSVQATGRPAPVSSFQVLDDLLRSLDDRKRLASLAGIVLAGHSAGGQLVQRYAVLNNIDGPLRRDGLALRYVIANPSSYLYLSNERPRADGKGYAPYERGICPTYNQYKYGPDKLPAYSRETDESKLFVRYAARDVTYLLGGADNNPEDRLLDKTCGAEAQGATRLARGTGYVQYEHILAARGAKPVTLHRRAFEVAGIGHNSKNMFGSACGTRALLGDEAQAADGAAPCVVIKPRGK